MRAAVLYEFNQPLQIKELSQDSPKYGEVRVELGAAGICASDDHVFRGELHSGIPLPLVLGHEGSGTVVEVGEGVKSLKKDDHVKVSSGPFIDFNGVVEEVNKDKQKVRVIISIFGRPTPVELDFFQVEMYK